MPELDDLAKQIADRLISRHESVAVAESSAGGLISAALLEVAGASAYYKGGVVVYTGAGKQTLAGMTQEQLVEHRSATAPHTLMLAQTIQKRMGATWGIAETGVAGPTGNRYGDAAGHAAIAIAGPAEQTEIIETGHGDRRKNMEAFAAGALELLLSALDTDERHG